MLGQLILLLLFYFASFFGCSSVSSFPKDIHSWHGLACLKLLPEGSFAFSHINSASADFYPLRVPSAFPALRVVSCSVAPGQSCIQCALDGGRTDYGWLLLCLFWRAAITSVLEELLMACLVLKVLAFL